VRTTIDTEHARRVADAFLAAPHGPADPRTRAAYAELGEQVDRWFAAMTRPDAKHAVRVAFTACAQPYSSAAELSEAVRSQRVIEITPCVLDRERTHPLLDSSVGGTYDRLRAVHDVVSHGWRRYGFDRDGEFAAWAFEDRMYTGLARDALATELHAEHSVLWTTGCLAEHKATLLDERLVTMSRARTASETSKGR
jgi:hypothetical protein